jgi:hypothetical protein
MATNGAASPEAGGLCNGMAQRPSMKATEPAETPQAWQAALEGTALALASSDPEWRVARWPARHGLCGAPKVRQAGIAQVNNIEL